MAVQECVRLLNGKCMPIIGLGTWQSAPGQVQDAVRVAIEAGYRHIDTAQMYGNEAEIGEALDEIFKEGRMKREDIFITTKLAMAAMAPENVRRETELSLKKLKTDYIDLFLIHFPVAVSDEGLKDDPPNYLPTYKNGASKTVFIDPLDTWREMEKLVDDGLVRAIGLSNFNKEQVLRIYEEARIKPANLQMECHAWLSQYDLYEFCKERGISFTAYSPLGSPNRPPGMLGPRTEVLMEESVVNELAAKHHKTPAQILLRNLIQRGIIVIPKSVTPERIKSNFQVWDFSLTDVDMDLIKSIDKGLRCFRYYSFGRQKLKQMEQQDGERNRVMFARLLCLSLESDGLL